MREWMKIKAVKTLKNNVFLVIFLPSSVQPKSARWQTKKCIDYVGWLGFWFWAGCLCGPHLDTSNWFIISKKCSSFVTADAELISIVSRKPIKKRDHLKSMAGSRLTGSKARRLHICTKLQCVYERKLGDAGGFAATLSRLNMRIHFVEELLQKGRSSQWNMADGEHL